MSPPSRKQEQCGPTQSGSTGVVPSMGLWHASADPHDHAPEMQIINAAKVYPVIIIGSGASGGMAAWNLTQKGIDVLVLDAGQKFDRSKYWTHVRPWEARERQTRGETPPAFFLDTKEQPYFTQQDRQFDLY